MTVKQVVPRTRARQDIDHVVDWYTDEGGIDVASAFIAALERAYRLIAEHPSTGSPRYAHELDIPGLRSKTLGNFPYLIFYLDRDDYVDVLRVLHAQRDIPSSMQELER